LTSISSYLTVKGTVALAHVTVGGQHVPLQFVRTRLQAGGVHLQDVGLGLFGERQGRRGTVFSHQKYARPAAINAYVEAQSDVQLRT
jgi:hypothetical protein